MSDKDVLVARLHAYVNKVPAGINSASTQTVRRYKEWVGVANKAIKAGNKNTQHLTSLLNQYEAFK